VAADIVDAADSEVDARFIVPTFAAVVASVIVDADVAVTAAVKITMNNTSRSKMKEKNNIIAEMRTVKILEAEAVVVDVEDSVVAADVDVVAVAAELVRKRLAMNKVTKRAAVTDRFPNTRKLLMGA
jgi:hypothetical protein